MNVLSRKPISLAEAKALANNVEEKKELADYFKKFSKISREKADKIINEVRELNNPKIKEEDMVKIADFLPKDLEELNKIFSQVSLTEEEANAVLAIVGKN